jgi:integrase
VALVMLDCGLRPEEVHRLRWSNIRDGAIEVHTGKGSGSRRRITVTQRLDAVLAQRDREGPFVFPAPTKSGHIEQSSYKDLHEKAVLASAVPRFVPYDMRHTCITRWANSGMPVAALQKLAGHRNVATTMRYVHLAGTDALAWLDKFRAGTELGTLQTSVNRGGHKNGHSL